MSPDVRIALVTAPSDAVALELARSVVDEGLAACANLLPGVTSVFRWEGEVRDEAEVLLILKTTAECAERLRARIVELHPYDVPEVIWVEVAGGHAPYLDWVAGATESV